MTEDAQCGPLTSHQAHIHEHMYACKNIKEALVFVKIRSQVTMLLMASYTIWYFISKLKP